MAYDEDLAHRVREQLAGEVGGLRCAGSLPPKG